MAGFVDGVLDPDQWAQTPAELSRVIGDQLDDAATLDAPGRAEWVAVRWGGPVLLNVATLGQWVEAWRAECRSSRALGSGTLESPEEPGR